MWCQPVHEEGTPKWAGRGVLCKVVRDSVILGGGAVILWAAPSAPLGLSYLQVRR